jgi:hypothetical protein
MTPVDSDLSQRFAKSYTTAAFGYARAASAAYAVMADQTIDFWSRAATTAAPDNSPRSVTPQLSMGPRPYRAAYVPAKTEGSSPPVDFVRLSNAWANSPMFAPVRAWWGLFPLEGPPASWPMAYAMMTAGVPRTVALPAAEANAAAMDAADVAKQSIDRAFSSYRSDSGFAVSQILAPKNLFSALFLAPFASFKFPWA